MVIVCHSLILFKPVTFSAHQLIYFYRHSDTHRAVCPLLCWQARWGVVRLACSWSVMGVCDGASGWFGPLRVQSPPSFFSLNTHLPRALHTMNTYPFSTYLSFHPSIRMSVRANRRPPSSCLSSRQQLNPGRPRLLLKLQIIFLSLHPTEKEESSL